MICYHHEHSHGHDHCHDHDHEHHHHHHDHDHSHCHAEGCGSCTACDPMKETVALMDYMVKHNMAHAKELAQLSEKLRELGNPTAAEQTLQNICVSSRNFCLC